MNDINNCYDRHLDPPEDDIEQEYCESCGQPMELCTKGYTHFTCENQFCPEKFDIKCGTTVIDMAKHLAEVEQELADAKNDLKYAQARITNLKIRLDRLTQSQVDFNEQEQRLSNSLLSPVRDTEYAIKRLTEAFDYHEDDCDPYAMSVFRKEWAEVKKILESYG